MIGGMELLVIFFIVLLCLGTIIVLAGLSVWLYQRGSKGDDFIFKVDTREEKDPLDILRRRYAQGEISKAEFEEIRQDLQGE